MNCKSEFAPAMFTDQVLSVLKETADQVTIDYVASVWKSAGTNMFQYREPEIITVTESSQPSKKKRSNEEPREKANDNCEDGEIITPDSETPSPATAAADTTSSNRSPTPASSLPPPGSGSGSSAPVNPRPQKKSRFNNQARRNNGNYYNDCDFGHQEDDWYGPRGSPAGRGRPGHGPQRHGPSAHRQPHGHRGHSGHSRNSYRGNFRGMRK